MTSTFLHAGAAPFASRAVPMHALLNPDALFVAPVAPPPNQALLLTPAAATVNAISTPPTAQPKRRGRKPHLPKMTNSERGKYYRSKHKRYDETLTRSVGLLRSRVERLRAVRDICCDLSLSTRMDVNLPGPFVRFVREYAEQFRHGVQLPPTQRNMSLPDVEVSTVQQDVFMRAVMEPDVAFGEYRGIAVIMDQWTRYSQYHALLVWELMSVEISGPESAPIVSTSAVLRTRYSRKTIENVFPHVVGNEPLIQRLIGREIVYPAKNTFIFNSEGRVERYDVEADFVGALVSALGSTEDAALLLGQALIQQDHLMGALDDDSDGCGYSSSASSSSDAHCQPHVHYSGEYTERRANRRFEDNSDGNTTSDDSDCGTYSNYTLYDNGSSSSGPNHNSARKLEVEYLLDANI